MENEILKTLSECRIDDKFAVGNDLVFMPVFQLSLTDVFKHKVYTPAEMTYCDLFDNSLLRYASTWAAKEAVYKAVKQISNAGLAWKKIEIIREKTAGRPHVIMHQYPGKYDISVTISHDGDYVWAIALIKQSC
ncbi:4'-phosphopantetheinyl transferase superfamily protein [Mucilaginibacter sp.]|uniref:holo-ACP synthase n=1 Tax=Mucilaginibacter sp. TaxID=1882438 RepID=UPI00262D663F|nr:4'-phosphopantetheinyl transferase superfamily protein [Mucilaginibacter sp.]MDB5032356.1 4-phosphopantetheinyl transferase [Mucilaginibacter sp.]